MDRATYDRFTKHLVDVGQSDDRIVGLVAVGSMADKTRRDGWSDHDFWIVTTNGEAAAFRSEIWLPDPDRVVVHFNETAHGRSAVYDDGHLIEYAVFDEDELLVARANVYEVLVDKGGIEGRMRAMAAQTQTEHESRDPSGQDRFGSFVAQMVIGLTRYGRGEKLSANHLVRGWAVRSLLSCLALVMEADRPEALDNLDPHRRFEQGYPALAGRINEALEQPVPELGRVLVDIVEERVVGRIETATPEAIAALRTVLERVVDS